MNMSHAWLPENQEKIPEVHGGPAEGTFILVKVMKKVTGKIDQIYLQMHNRLIQLQNTSFQI